MNVFGIEENSGVSEKNPFLLLKTRCQFIIFEFLPFEEHKKFGLICRQLQRSMSIFKRKQRISFLDLHFDLQLFILGFFCKKELLNIRMVSKYFLNLSSHNILWYKKIPKMIKNFDQCKIDYMIKLSKKSRDDDIFVDCIMTKKESDVGKHKLKELNVFKKFVDDFESKKREELGEPFNLFRFYIKDRRNCVENYYSNMKIFRNSIYNVRINCIFFVLFLIVIVIGAMLVSLFVGTSSNPAIIHNDIALYIIGGLFLLFSLPCCILICFCYSSTISNLYKSHQYYESEDKYSNFRILEKYFPPSGTKDLFNHYFVFFGGIFCGNFSFFLMLPLFALVIGCFFALIFNLPYSISLGLCFTLLLITHVGYYFVKKENFAAIFKKYGDHKTFMVEGSPINRIKIFENFWKKTLIYFPDILIISILVIVDVFFFVQFAIFIGFFSFDTEIFSISFSVIIGYSVVFVAVLPFLACGVLIQALFTYIIVGNIKQECKSFSEGFKCVCAYYTLTVLINTPTFLLLGLFFSLLMAHFADTYNFSYIYCIIPFLVGFVIVIGSDMLVIFLLQHSEIWDFYSLMHKTYSKSKKNPNKVTFIRKVTSLIPSNDNSEHMHPKKDEYLELSDTSDEFEEEEIFI